MTYLFPATEEQAQWALQKKHFISPLSSLFLITSITLSTRHSSSTQWWVWYILSHSPSALQSSGLQSPSHNPACPSLHPWAQTAGVYREIFGLFLSVGSPPTCFPSLTFTRIHSASLLTSCYSGNLKGSKSPSLKALWWTSQSKTGERDWCKILPCGKRRRFRCWRRTLTRWSNWGYHSWAKVQLWEELTCDTNTMNTTYFSSPI